MPNEIKIMDFTGPSFPIDYCGKSVPRDYVCECCGKRGRLWRRRDDNRASVDLYCVKCKTEHLGFDAVPAIPMPDNTAYWRFEETPKGAHAWWIDLPSLFKQGH